MIRRDARLLVIDEFSGVNQLVDELKLSGRLVPESYGGYANEKRGFERLRGKLATTGATSGAHVLVLQQLIFGSETVMLIHQGTEYKTEADLSQLMVDEPDRVPVATPIDPILWD